MTTARNLAAFGTTAANYTGRNRIINGAFSVWQRGTSLPTSGGGIGADMWRQYSDTGGVGTQSKDTTIIGPTGGNPLATQSYKITANASSGGNWTLFQIIESLNCADLAGKTVTFSVYLASSVSRTIKLAVSHSTSTDAPWNGSWTTTFSANPTVTSSLTRYTLTGTIPSTAKTLQVGIATGVGGLMANGSTINVACAQLEEGGVATPFEFKSYGQEFAECQRYYTKSVGDIWLGCTSGGLSNTYSYTCQFPVRMRATPVLTTYVGGTPNLVTWYPGGSSSASDSPDKLDAEAFIVRKNGVSTYTLAIFSYTASAEL